MQELTKRKSCFKGRKRIASTHLFLLSNLKKLLQDLCMRSLNRESPWILQNEFYCHCPEFTEWARLSAYRSSHDENFIYLRDDGPAGIDLALRQSTDQSRI